MGLAGGGGESYGEQRSLSLSLGVTAASTQGRAGRDSNRGLRRERGECEAGKCFMGEGERIQITARLRVGGG